MARKNKKTGKKVRIEFRRNRAGRTRDKDWIRKGDADDTQLADTQNTERVVAKGGLSRKRTIIVGGDGSHTAESGHTGVVVTVFGLIAHVDDGQRIWPCTVRRVLRTRRIDERSTVTVGDRVRFCVPADRQGVHSEGVIEEIEPRTGELKRITGRKQHTFVANVDQALIVSSADSPKPKPHLVDRYIISALHGGIEPVVVLNKIDLVEQADVDAFVDIYEHAGHKTISVSAENGQGVDALREVLRGKASVVAGQSGVGKSSLLNAVQPNLGLAIGTVVADTTKGRHTTTRASLIKLDVGGYVVDTPGVRSFDLACVPRERLEEFFVEFLPFIPHCRFPDCTHTHETECAVKQALDAGSIHISRYDSYERLFTDTQFRTDLSDSG